jgi:hypothetical protein
MKVAEGDESEGCISSTEKQRRGSWRKRPGQGLGWFAELNSVLFV